MAQTAEIIVKGLPSSYEVEHLARVFFAGAKLRQSGQTGAATAQPGAHAPLVYARAGKHHLAAALREESGPCHVRRVARPAEEDVVLALCRLLYDILCDATGIRPPWGLLTGVRPVNLLRKKRAVGGKEAARRHMVELCGASEEKFALAAEIYDIQQPFLAVNTPESYSLYVSIPFCPSRCNYCSFVSRTIEREGHLTGPYLEKLEQELAFTAGAANRLGLKLETVYIGGGTPTALATPELETLLKSVQKHFAPETTREYTVEAGRPDCTGPDKLKLLKDYGVTRLSINPQTMDDGVLRAIGRRHTAADVVRCYEDARKAGHKNINMDLIAGLTGDTPGSFAQTIAAVAAMEPENITLHTLTLKRASTIVVEGEASGKETDIPSPGSMVQMAGPVFRQNGYHPYSLSRQKSGVENLENTGWARPGAEGWYNVFIMEEAHTILAVGAGASTKLVDNENGRIQRIYNYKFPTDYIAQFDDILERKRGVETFYAGNLDT